MAGNGNSGRRPRREEEKKLIAKSYKKAVRVLIAALDSMDEQIKVGAAKYLIDQHIGKASQKVEHTGQGDKAIVLKVIYGDGD